MSMKYLSRYVKANTTFNIAIKTVKRFSDVSVRDTLADFLILLNIFILKYFCFTQHDTIK